MLLRPQLHQACEVQAAAGKVTGLLVSYQRRAPAQQQPACPSTWTGCSSVGLCCWYNSPRLKEQAEFREKSKIAGLHTCHGCCELTRTKEEQQQRDQSATNLLQLLGV